MRTTLRFVVVSMALAASVVRSSDAATITVQAPGNINQINERLTIAISFVKEVTGVQARLADTTNPGTKATYLANLISGQAKFRHVTAAVNAAVVTVRGRPGYVVTGLSYDGGRPIPNSNGLPEKLKLQLDPDEIAFVAGIILRFAFSAADGPGSGGSVQLDIGGPGGGMYAVADTTGMSHAQMLAALAGDINDNPSGILSASSSANELVVYGASVGNDIAAIVTDPELGYEYEIGSVVSVPFATREVFLLLAVLLLCIGVGSILWDRA